MNAEIPKNILLVEDELIIALANSRTLSSLGYEVIIANSGEEAVEITRIKHKIDLVLMDIDLGVGMDGTKAAELILTKRDIPVLFLSSRTDSDTIKKTESITSYGYVVKGSNETVLGASIKMAFKLFDANQTTKEVNRKLKVSINKIKENERRLQLATRLAKLGIWDWNIATDYTVWEGSMYEIYGVSPDEFTHLGTDYLDYVHDDSKEIQKKYIEESFKNAITEDGLLNGEFMKDNPTKLRVIRPNGTEVFILGEAVAVVDNDGIPTRMLGVVIDVTEKT